MVLLQQVQLLLPEAMQLMLLGFLCLMLLLLLLCCLCCLCISKAFGQRGQHLAVIRIKCCLQIIYDPAFCQQLLCCCAELSFQ